MSRQEQSAMQRSVLDKKYEEQKLLNPQKFLEDYRLIYQKLIDYEFRNIDSKTASKTAASTNKYLVYQLIWTLKYVVALAVVENENEWLKNNLPKLKVSITQIKNNIVAADPNRQENLQEGIDKLFEKIETLLKNENRDVALNWIENIVSLGGSAVREGSANYRRALFKRSLEEKAGYIADHNAAALLRAENYQQYLQETKFNKENASLIIAYNRSKQLKYIEEGLKKNAKNKYLLAEKEEFSREEKKQDEKESQVRKYSGDETYSKVLERRKIKLEKIHIREELSTLAQEYLKTNKSLYLENTEFSKKIVLEISRLQKSLSKILAKDKIPLQYQKLKEQLKDIRDEIRNLKSLSEKSPFRQQNESKLLAGSTPTPIVMTLMAKRMAQDDFKSISTVKAVSKDFFKWYQSLKNSDHPSSRNEFIAEQQKSYEDYIVRSAKFFLSRRLPAEKYLFEIDIKKDFTANEVYEKFNELALIFDPNKLSTKEAKSVGQLIFPLIEQTKQKLISQLCSVYDTQIGGPMKGSLTVILRDIEQAKKLLELPVSDKTLILVSKNNNNVFNEPRANERRSSVLNSPSILKK